MDIALVRCHWIRYLALVSLLRCWFLHDERWIVVGSPEAALLRSKSSSLWNTAFLEIVLFRCMPFLW